MLFGTVGQSRVFLTMLYAGLLLGLYADLDSAARRLFRAGRLLSVLMDLFFGVAAACIVFSALLAAADGELRLYSLMGACCGYLIWAGTLSPVLPRLFRFPARLVLRLLTGMKKNSFMKKLFR